MHLPSTASGSASSVDSPTGVRPLADWYAQMEEAERRDGWLAWCRDHECYVAASEELVAALAQTLKRFTGPILEVGSGRGELAEALSLRSVNVIATDCSPGGATVIALDACEALRRYRPETVLSNFLPVDAGIEAEVMRYASVRRYLYIGPTVMGRVGPESLWRASGWRAEPLPDVNHVLVSRLDFLTDFTRGTHRRQAGAVLFERVEA